MKIAYMDHLDIPADRPVHKIDYSVPRIFYVTNTDFDFVAKIDKSRLQLNAFGQQPFRKTSPYTTPASMGVQDQQNTSRHLEEDIVVPSLQEWLSRQKPSTSRQPESSSRSAAGTSAGASVESLPEEYQILLAQHYSLVDKDIDDFASAMAMSMKQQVKEILVKCSAELAVKLRELNRHNVNVHRTENINANSPTAKGKESSTPPFPADQSIPPDETTDPILFDVPIPPDETTDPVHFDVPILPDETIDPTHSPVPNPPNDSTQSPMPSSAPVSPVESTKEPILSSTSALLEESTKQPMPSSPTTSPKGGHYVPSFDLFSADDPEYEDVCGYHSRNPTPTCHTTTKTLIDKHTGSSTFEKKNRRKRFAYHVTGMDKPKRLKADVDSKEMWNKYLFKRAFDKGFMFEGECQSPPFIEICGFHVTYDEFYESFKTRGMVSNNVMALWCYQFNLDQLNLLQNQKTKVSKFAFPQLASNCLIVDPASFKNDESCKRIYNKINETWNLSKVDLMFFPILFEEHWVLVCVSMYMKEVALFDSLSDTMESTCLKSVQNLILNFTATTMKFGVLKHDVSQFKWIQPKGYPLQKNVFDCGLYVMDYMESWDGKEIVLPALENASSIQYRKHVAGLLLLSSRNTVDLEEFKKQYDAKKIVQAEVV